MVTVLQRVFTLVIHVHAERIQPMPKAARLVRALSFFVMFRIKGKL